MSERTREQSVLTEVIQTVASTLELGEVLRAVVRLLTEGSGVHACFVYFLDDSGDRLVLKAASRPYEHLVDEAFLSRGEGLGWWVAEHREPVFIRDDARSDPRFKVVAGIDEDRFQSFLCVPLVGRGAETIGVITAHTEAPREFTRDEADFLISSATLVAGAIENARQYEDARRRVQDLERLTGLADEVARADTLDELLGVVAERAIALLRAESCRLYLLDPGTEELELRAVRPPSVSAPARIGLADLGPELSRGRRSRISVPLVASRELVGLIVADGTDRLDLGRAVASQAAVAIQKVRLIESLTERNLIRDFFDDLAGGSVTPGLERKATRLDCDLSRPHLVLSATDAPEPFERALVTLAPGSLFDRRDHDLHGVLRVPAGGADQLLDGVRTAHEAAGGRSLVGISAPAAGAGSIAAAFVEARQAQLGAGLVPGAPVRAYEELGAHKYLLRIADDTGRDATVAAVTRLVEYDRRRGTHLLATLEEFLGRRGSITATSEALYVHPNTLRQRLRRISDLSGIDLRRDDWLMVEIAVKLVRLRTAAAARRDDP